jgi:hypothetical protein
MVNQVDQFTAYYQTRNWGMDCIHPPQILSFEAFEIAYHKLKNLLKRKSQKSIPEEITGMYICSTDVGKAFAIQQKYENKLSLNVIEIHNDLPEGLWAILNHPAKIMVYNDPFGFDLPLL